MESSSNLAPRGRSRTPFWLRPLVALEQAHGWRRWMLVILILIVPGVFLLRHASISGLPDLGEPFNDSHFLQSIRVPEAHNAFIAYGKAADQLIPLKSKSLNGPINDRSWFDANTVPLALWLEGTSRSDCQQESGIPSVTVARVPEMTELIRLGQLAMIEVKEKIQSNDPARAYTYLNGMIRYRFHLTQLARLDQSIIAQALDQLIEIGFSNWLEEANPSTDLIRKAQTDLTSASELIGHVSAWIQTEYLKKREYYQHGIDTQLSALEFAKMDRPNFLLFLPGGPSLYWFVKHEPERSMRILKLAVTNWLSQCDKPSASRAGIPTVENGLQLYETSLHPNASSAARALSPASLNTWYESSLVARQTLYPWWTYERQSIDSARRLVSVLRYKLATALYRREHGTEPPLLESLVKEGYLDQNFSEGEMFSGKSLLEQLE